mmetsp:Transcript_21943/g.36288  ORF Transcript_21943/g.36288 Transcript_21943/m.36288 type:complete len:267 (+) Transcript_21943:43-843(+)
MLRFFFLFLFGASSVLSFTLQNSAVVKTRHESKNSHQITKLRLAELEVPAEAMFARGDCVFWFFGASGAAGIARTTFPRMYDRFVATQKLKDVGPTLGGATMGISPLYGYPKDLCTADVEQVVNNPLTVGQVVADYPVENNYMSSKGYLTAKAFVQANSQSNPLAVRAVFDAFAQSTDNVDPDVAQRMLDVYKSGDLGALKNNLAISKLFAVLGIATLLFLLGIADIIAFSDVYKGWFPDWPGGHNFPFGMMEPDGSPFKIPDYWI